MASGGEKIAPDLREPNPARSGTGSNWLDNRFRLVFALAALALMAINAGVAVSAWRLQQDMRDVAINLYDRAFIANNDMNNARVQFQRFADQRESASGLAQILRVNQLLDPAADALDAAADLADDPAMRKESLDARSTVLAFEANFLDSGPAVWSQLKQTQATLDQISAHALAHGLQTRGAIERTARNATLLLIGSLIAGGALGLTTLIILWQTIAVSTMSRLSQMANYNSVTGLPNRNLLQSRLTEILEGVRRNDGRLALLTIDLDRFKQVNDTLGHHVGDRLLMEAGERIRRVIRAEDTAARFGGDEFVVLLRDVRDAAEAGAIAERLVAALGAAYELNGQRAHSGASIGIALAPQHGETPQDLLRNSEIALYQAKVEGKGISRFFDAELNKQVQERRLMEIDLRETLERDRLNVHFQPVIEVGGGRIVACEALARWTRPGHGIVPPSEFIALAEETGLIIRLGEAVLRKACREAARWPDPLKVSVNLSAAQFQDDLVETVEDILRTSELPANRLELEITESILVGDKTRVLHILNQLRDLGVGIALDDFGTGYSSLSYLSSFPFDRIKIDRSFVTDVEARPEAAAIARAVMGLAQTLGMGTTAEGVETQNDLEWLRGHGCEYAQGYLVSKPISPDDFRKFLDAWRGERLAAASIAA